MPSKDTKIVSARIPNSVEFGVPVSRVLMDIYGLIRDGVLRIEDEHIVGESPVSGREYCEGCEYMDLDMSKFNEVCEYRDLDRQKALDRCAQMLWR